MGIKVIITLGVVFNHMVVGLYIRWLPKAFTIADICWRYLSGSVLLQRLRGGDLGIVNGRTQVPRGRYVLVMSELLIMILMSATDIGSSNLRA